MRSLWSQWPKIRERVKHNDFILLFDFDGTLAPIAPRPPLARLPARTRSALKILSRKSRVRVGVVSGRALNEVRRLVRLKNIAYIGSHGLEVCLPGEKTQLRLSSTLLQWLRGLARDLRKTLAGLRGPWLEQKIAGVAVHYRQADVPTAKEAVKRLQIAARRWRKQFKIQKGKMVFEFVPAGSTTKGTAVRELAKKLRAGRHSTVFYFGDDLTDETVFSTLSKRDFGILVGERRPSGACFRLRSPKEVGQFLNRLGETTI